MRELRAGSVRVDQARLVAVIDIGAIGIRILVAEIQPSGEFRVVDRSERPVGLGRDVFTNGLISREAMAQSLEILRRYREMLDGWKIARRDIHVIATSALREARNRDTFIDRVELRTGFKISIIEGVEANRLTYIAVRYALGDQQAHLVRSNSLIIEVGGGTTEIMLLEHGHMVSAHSLSVGTARIEPQLESVFGSSDQLLRFLGENVRTTTEILNSEMRLKSVRNFIAVGGDARMAAQQVGEPIGEHLSLISRESFEGFYERIKALSVDGCVRELAIPYADAESLIPALMIYRMLLDETGAQKLIVPDVSIRDGVLLSLARGPDPELQREFNEQVAASAISLGRKYRFDERHARHVARLALRLFDELEAEHGLDPFHRVLLRVGALLHDIGTFIAATGHHKHGQYLVASSEIFGLDREDIAVVSNVVRYHRKSIPAPGHVSFMSLPRSRRIVVMKLAAILRVADALDRGHKQTVRSFGIDKRDDEIVLHCNAQGDISVERFGIARKADLFEEVFGMKVVVL